jgi:hypothetical protein
MNRAVGRPAVRTGPDVSTVVDGVPAPALRVVCAWCEPPVGELEPGTTHGICRSCLERQLGRLAPDDDGAVWRNMRHHLTLR